MTKAFDEAFDDKTQLGKRIADLPDAPTRIAQRPGTIVPAPEAVPLAEPGIGIGGPVARVPKPALERYVIRRREPGQPRAELLSQSLPASRSGTVVAKKPKPRWLVVTVVVGLGLAISATAVAALIWLLTTP
jgi:hypothetical protein